MKLKNSPFRDSTDKRFLYSKCASFGKKLLKHFYFKGDGITLYPNLNWAKIQDPDPNSMYPVFGSTTL